MGTITSSGIIKTACLATPFASGKTWGGTVEYYGASGQAVTSGTYNNLTLTTAQTFTASGSLVVNGTLTITNSSGILDLAATYTLTGTLGTVTNSGKIKTACLASPFATGKTWSGTVEYYGAGGQSVASGTYNNLTLTTAQTFIASGALVVNGTLTITSASGTLDMSTYQLTGTLTAANSGTLKTSSTASPAIPTGKTWGGTVQYAATAGGQYIAGGTYNNLTSSNTSNTNTVVTSVLLFSSLPSPLM